jgi:hypothetical protein
MICKVNTRCLKTRYGYVLNSPLSYVDPSGEWYWLIPLVFTYAKGVVDNGGEWNPTKWSEVPAVGTSVIGSYGNGNLNITAVPTLTPTGTNTALAIGTISPEGGWNIDFNVGTGKNEEPGFGQGLVDGFEGGIDSTVDFLKV